MRKIWFVLLISIVFGSIAFIANAENAFEIEQKGSVRTNVNLYGGYVEDLAIDSASRVYAALNSPNGIFVLQPNAQEWSAPPSGTDTGSIIAVEISDQENTAYVIGGIRLFQTTDGGASWNEIAGSTGDTVESDYSQTLLYVAGTLYVPVRDGSLDISTDEGATFENQLVDDDITSIVAFAASVDGNDVYVLAAKENNEERTLYHGHDDIWESMNLIGNYAQIEVRSDEKNTIIVAGNDGAQISHDGGTTWQSFEDEAVYGDIMFQDDRIFLGRQYTDDQGETWNQMTSDLNVRAQTLAVDPNDANIIYADSLRGVMKSVDGGATWEDVVDGLLGVTIHDIAQSDDKSIVWLAAQGGLAKTENFTADQVVWEFPIVPDQASDTLQTVWINPDDHDIVLTGGSALHRSIDGGTTWEQVLGDGGTPGTFMTIVANEDHSAIYVGFASQDNGAGTVYVSEDDGATWTDLEAPGIAVNAIVVRDDESLIVGIGTERVSDSDKRGLYEYNRSTWTQIDGAEGQLVNDLIRVNDVMFVAGGETSTSGVFRSSDNGETWEDITNNGLPNDGWFQALTVDTKNTDQMYVSTARPAGTGFIYKSTNGGDSWNVYYEGLVDEKFQSMLFDGLLSGTNTGLYTMQSNVKLTLRMTTKKKERMTTIRATVTLRDATTDQGLRGRRVILKAKKKNGDWQRVGRGTTVAKGRVVFLFSKNKWKFLRAQWKPSTTDESAYGRTAQYSARKNISL